MDIPKTPQTAPETEVKQPGLLARVPWNPWVGVIFVALVFFCSQVFGAIVVSIYPRLQHWTQQQASTWVNSSVAAQFLFVLLAESFVIASIYLFLSKYKLRFAAIGLDRPRLKYIVYAFAAVPVYFGLYLLAVVVVGHLFPSFNPEQTQEIGFNNVSGALPLIVTFISLVVLPPLAEEIMVRGFLYSSLKKGMPQIAAAVVTSLIFASAHLSEGGAAGPLYIAAVDTFILSLVLIYLRNKTSSLWPGITLHAIKNGIAYFALFIAPLLSIHFR